jgi:GNAT superfamily N-acetyltransferase
MLPNPLPLVVVRAATPEDAPACGQICYDAFSTISGAHGFPCDLPVPEAGIGLLSMMFSNPGFYCVVAEVEDRIVGSNCLDERSKIFGVGPITIDPSVQNRSIGRTLMQAVMDRAIGQGAAGIRLVQAAFHNRSLSLSMPISGLMSERRFPACRGEPFSGVCLDARCGRHNSPISRSAISCPGRCMDSVAL